MRKVYAVDKACTAWKKKTTTERVMYGEKGFKNFNFKIRYWYVVGNAFIHFAKIRIKLRIKRKENAIDQYY